MSARQQAARVELRPEPGIAPRLATVVAARYLVLSARAMAALRSVRIGSGIDSLVKISESADRFALAIAVAKRNDLRIGRTPGPALDVGVRSGRNAADLAQHVTQKRVIAPWLFGGLLW